MTAQPTPPSRDNQPLEPTPHPSDGAGAPDAPNPSSGPATPRPSDGPRAADSFGPSAGSRSAGSFGPSAGSRSAGSFGPSDGPRSSELTPPADPWSSAAPLSSSDPLSLADPLFQVPTRPTADPLAAAPPSPPATPAAPPAYSPPAPQPPSYPPTSGAPQQPWHGPYQPSYPPTPAAQHQPGYPPQAYPAPAYPGAASAYPPPPTGGIPQPYGPAPYAYRQPYADGPVKSLHVPSRLAIAGLALTAVYSLLLQVAAASVTSATFDGTEPRFLIGAFLGYAAVFVFTAAAFLTWLHRASTNLWNTGHTMKWRPGWTVGAWLIPVANLVMPLLVVREVDRETRDHGPGLFAVWAVAWTLDLILERASGTSSGPTSGLGILSMATLPVAAVAAVLLVRRVTADQQQQFPQPY